MMPARICKLIADYRDQRGEVWAVRVFVDCKPSDSHTEEWYQHDKRRTWYFHTEDEATEFVAHAPTCYKYDVYLCSFMPSTMKAVELVFPKYYKDVLHANQLYGRPLRNL